MRLISCHAGRLHEQVDFSREFSEKGPVPAWSEGSRRPGFFSGLPALDAVVPCGGFARGAVHELLYGPGDPAPVTIAGMFARSATKVSTKGPGVVPTVFWFDPAGSVFPPALSGMGIGLGDLWIVRPRDEKEQLWGIAECLRCAGVGVVVAALGRLNRLDARRLQLAAERGGATAFFIRSADQPTYAAATRWVVTPRPGDRAIQRWGIQLVHGHGGRVGQHVLLEHYRENHFMRAVSELVGGEGGAAREAERRARA